MDPLSAGMLGYKLGKFGGDLWWGTHAEKVDQALGFIEDYEQSNFTHEPSLRKAISILEQIPDDEKDYILAGKNYYLALCYAIEKMYRASLRCLDFVKGIEIGTFTACAETIDSIKKDSYNLRTRVLELMNKEDSQENCEDDDFEDEAPSEFDTFDDCLHTFISDEYSNIDELLDAVQELIDRTTSRSELENLNLLAAVACLDEIKKCPGRCCYTQNIQDYIEPGCNYIDEAIRVNGLSSEIKIVYSALHALYDFSVDKNFISQYYKQHYMIDCERCLVLLKCSIFSEEYIIAIYHSIFDFILNYCTPDGNEEILYIDEDVLEEDDDSISSGELSEEEAEYLNEYKEMLCDGEISERDRRFLSKIMKSNGISEQRAKELEAMAVKPSLSEEEQEYLDEYREIISEGEISARDQRFLEKLKKTNGISESRAQEIESMA